MRILVSGASGFIGSALVRRLEAEGHRVLPLRHTPRENLTRAVSGDAGSGPAAIAWSPESGVRDPGALEGIEAVVHLAGETIAGRWTQAKKRRIRASRVTGTRLLAEALLQRERPPRVFVCASGVGYYGDRGSEELTEASAPGTDFMARLCVEWEEACRPLAERGVRVVNVRTAPVLGPGGGLLGPMLPVFRLGLGGPLGNGRAFMSWIERGDLVNAYCHVLRSDDVSGPVNAAAPESVTNAEFTRTLAGVLRRPAFFRVPVPLLRLALREFADAATASARVVPARLIDGRFTFRYPRLEPALRAVLHHNSQKLTEER